LPPFAIASENECEDCERRNLFTGDGSSEMAIFDWKSTLNRLYRARPIEGLKVHSLRAVVVFFFLFVAAIGLESAAQSSGSATAGVFAPVKDSDMRPITAGGFVKHGPVIFKDIAKQAGLTSWRHVMGTPEKKFILETTGSGVALLDYDNDGWLDIYIVNGSTYDAMKGTVEPPHAALFHNNHDGTFTDVADGVSASQSEITITMAGRISMSPTMAKTGCTTITMTAPSLTLQRRQALRWVIGPRGQLLATMTVMAD